MGQQHAKNADRRNEKRQADLSGYVFGQMMPSVTDLEEAVLGAIMTDRDAIGVVSDMLKPESFYHASNRAIYEACLSLFSDNSPIDILTVSDKLRKSGHLDAVGGSYTLTEMTNRVASSANVEYHSRIILQAAIKRRVIEISSNAIRNAYDNSQDPFDLLAEVERQFFGITNFSGKEGVTLADAGNEVMRQLMAAMERPDGLTGVNTGFSALNKATGGLQKSDLIILAARPGMGKTGLALNLALNAAKSGTPVGVFSLEMPYAQLAQRLVSAETGIPAEHIRTGKIGNDEMRRIDAAVKPFSEIPLHIDDSPGLPITALRAKARRMHKKHGIGLFVVDYIQLMGSESKAGQNREQEVSDMSRGLKMLAKELDVPIIGLSQLSRAVETRGGSKRPMLSDLRESGSLEQDADIVAFIYRPEYYGIEEDDTGQSLKGVTELILAKHRNGPPQTVLMGFDAPRVLFHDLKPADFTTPTDTQFPKSQPTDFSAMRPKNEEDIPF
jgi:replicative DNA helicase